jgi:hypothetical protein
LLGFSVGIGIAVGGGRGVSVGLGVEVGGETMVAVAAGAQAERRIISRRRKRGFMDSPTVLKIQGAG